MKIAEFLLARIAEDEAEYRVEEETANPGPWDRLLAECEAKRRAVKNYLGLWEAAKQLSRAGQKDQADVARNMYAGVEIALGALTFPYADHPDCDPSWSETD